MSETAADQLRRILGVIPRVADGQAHTIAELSELTGVDLPTLIGDCHSLTQRCDGPGGFIEGVAVLSEAETVSVTANHFHRPMRLAMLAFAMVCLSALLLPARGKALIPAAQT